MSNEDPLTNEINAKYKKLIQDSKLKKHNNKKNKLVVITSLFLGTGTFIGLIQVLLKVLY